MKKNATVTLRRVYHDGSTYWGQYNGGWISLKYTNYDEVLAGLEVWPKTGVVTGEGVNVRSGPGTSNPSQYKLSKGTRVVIHEKTYAGSMYWGRLDDGNWISLTYVEFDEVVANPDPTPPKPAVPPDPAADINGDGVPNEDDAIYLLQHVLMPDLFPLMQPVDYNQDSILNEDDAIYLLQHILMPDIFPLPSALV